LKFLFWQIEYSWRFNVSLHKFFFGGILFLKSENNIITELIWTICDDSGVEVETSVERFFEPTSGLCWLSDRLYRYVNDGSHFLKPSPLESNRQINSFIGHLPPERTEPEFSLKVKEPPVLLWKPLVLWDLWNTPNQRFLFENQRTTQHW
jgi:hypothetical protein